VVLSDEIRGRFDIVEDGKTGFIYPCGNVDMLARILANALGERGKLVELSRNAVKRMETWTPQMNLDGLAMAVERASSRQR
jgi:glycosyltransferase involved in cell wall biosynthesis